MKYKVTLWQGGKTFNETVHANNVKEAKETAQCRNPFCKVVSINATF